MFVNLLVVVKEKIVFIFHGILQKNEGEYACSKCGTTERYKTTSLSEWITNEYVLKSKLNYKVIANWNVVLKHKRLIRLQSEVTVEEKNTKVGHEYDLYTRL